MENEFVTNAFQEPPGLLVPCCVVAPADVAVVKVLHEELGLLNIRLFLSVCIGPHPLVLPGQETCSRFPLQRH